mgnify:CR=1 FL=1
MQAPQRPRPPRLILLSPGELEPSGLLAFEREVAAVALLLERRGALDVGLLLRETALEDRVFLELFTGLRRRHGALPLGIHDRAHLAALAERSRAARGLDEPHGPPRVGLERPWLHLAARSLAPGQVRALLPAACLGFSWHAGQTLPDPQALDYVCLSPLGAVPSKGPPLGIAGLAQGCRRTALPVWALGGVDENAAAEIFAAGAAGAMVGRAWRSALAAGRLEALLAAFGGGAGAPGRS